MRFSKRWFLVVPVAGLLSAHLPPPAAAQTDSLAAERLDRLERELATLKEEHDRLKKELGVEGQGPPVVVKPAGKEPVLKLGGFMQPQVEFGERGDPRFSDDNDRFLLRRARLNVTGKFAEDFAFKVEGDFSGSLGNASGLRAQLTDGYLDWTRYPEAVLRMGQFKTPFGAEQLTSDTRLLTAERSFASDRLTLGREVGAQFGGELAGNRVGWAAGAFNGTLVNTNFNDNDGFTFAARGTVVPWLGERDDAPPSRILLGVNGYHSRDANVAIASDFGVELDSVQVNVLRGPRAGFGADADFELSPFRFQAEYLRVRLEPANEIPAETITAHGGMALVGLDLWSPKLQAIARWEAFDPTLGTSDNATTIWTIGANYYIKGHDLKLVGNYLITDREALDEVEGRFLGRVQAVF